LPAPKPVTEIKRLTPFASDRIHKDTSGLRKQVRPAENVFRVWRYSKRLNDRVNAFQRTLNRPSIKRITIQFLKPGIVQMY
jgi:hypothetical protein